MISRYYASIPGDLDQAFGLMTADYQTRVAGGRQAYQRFWDGFSTVTATEVSGSPPSTVTALDHLHDQGRRGRSANGRPSAWSTTVACLKIARSTVTSRS